MHRRYHDRAPGARGHARRDDTAPRQDAAAAVLALQGSAGNQAVGALLARVPAGAPEKTERPEGAARVTLGDIGTIQVESVQLPPSGGGRGGPGGGGKGKPPVGELILTSRVGPHSSALLRASADGRAMDGRVEFRGDDLRLELTKAIVASYQVSTVDEGRTEHWTLDAEAVEFVTRQPEGGP